MEAELKKKFYRKFLLLVIGVLVPNVVLGILTVLFWQKLGVAKGTLIIPIVCSVVLLVVLIGSVVILLPYLMDWGLVIKSNYKVIKGTIQGNQSGEANGNAPASNYFPIVRAEDGTTFQILKADGAEPGKQYRFLYLPHTKLAVIIKEI